MAKRHHKDTQFRRSPCPVACALDIIGDKWTLLVVRDLTIGKRTYSEFLDSPENIPTNILAERLKRLVEYEIVEKKPYQMHPRRYAYTLSAKGRDLESVIMSMVHWGEKHIPGSKAYLLADKKR